MLINQTDSHNSVLTAPISWAIIGFLCTWSFRNREVKLVNLSGELINVSQIKDTDMPTTHMHHSALKINV